MPVLHVVPPTFLVTMFGVPECVALPSKVGETIRFVAHGQTWQCNRLRRSVYFLALDADPCGRARFGTAKEIAADIGVVLECGALPIAANNVH